MVTVSTRAEGVGSSFPRKRSLSLFTAKKPHSGEWKGLRKKSKNNVNPQKFTSYLANKIDLSGLAKHTLQGELRRARDGTMWERFLKAL